MVVETNWYGKKITCPSPLGLNFTMVSSADRANVVYRDLHGFHGGSDFEALFAFVIGPVSLRTFARKSSNIDFFYKTFAAARL